MENKPAVEFAAQEDEESQGSPTWWVLGGIGLMVGALAVLTAVPGIWESQIVGNTGRRGRLISGVLESIGFVPTVSILGGISALCLVAALISFLKWRRNESGE